MYAISIDLDKDALAKACPMADTAALVDLTAALSAEGFIHQGGLYVAESPLATPVTCTLAVMEVAVKCPWLRDVARSVQLLRIEEALDLLPAVTRGADLPDKTTHLEVEVAPEIYEGVHALVASGKYLSVSAALDAYLRETTTEPAKV